MMFRTFGVVGLLLSAGFLRAADGDLASPEQTVLSWYELHAVGKGPFLDEAQEPFWDFLFEADLAAVIRKKNWGQDPLYLAQDADVGEVRTKTIDATGGNALVLIAFSNFGHPVRLVAHLHLTDHGWRLSNIVEPLTGNDLLGGLDLGE